LGAVGVVLPALTGILPWLTPIAATGLVLTMIGAALTHLRRGEYPNIIANMVLLTLAVVVVFGRFFVTSSKRLPISTIILYRCMSIYAVKGSFN
jgi:hypothetical protein